MLIETSERIFRVVTFEGETKLCNLEHLNIFHGTLMFGGDAIKGIEHYWNHDFKTIGKKDVMEMIKLSYKQQ